MTAATAEWPLVSGLYRSPLLSSLGLVAGFTTASSGSMAGSVFPLEDQARARDAVARALGFDGVVRVRQVHGDRVLRADAPFPEPWPEADAVWTGRRGVLLAVAAADCVPVLVASPDGPIGAAHAGWDGTTKRVAQALVRTLAAHGADPATLHASIGPSIGPCCYAIDEERAAKIRARLGADAAGSLSAAGTAASGVPGGAQWTFDLWRANASQLEAAGVRHVELAGLCTRCGGADLWSYRARHERGPQGTGMAVLGRP